jgi:hypothetical protein
MARAWAERQAKENEAARAKTVMFAPPITAPLWSYTVPRMRPSDVCEWAEGSTAARMAPRYNEASDGRL